MGDCYLGNGNGNFQINYSEKIYPETETAIFRKKKKELLVRTGLAELLRGFSSRNRVGNLL